MCALQKHSVCILEMAGENYNLVTMMVSERGTRPQGVREREEASFILFAEITEAQSRACHILKLKNKNVTCVTNTLKWF